MIGALLLGMVAGCIGRVIVPDDLLENTRGPTSWLVSVGLGVLGALWGWVLLTACVGIGDTDRFDWGGILSALIGVLIVVLITALAIGQAASDQRPAST